jgi:hypothetical protein
MATCEHSASYLRDGKTRCALCDLREATTLLRKAWRQIDDYRVAMIDARDSLGMKEDPEEVGARIHIALAGREYLGYAIAAALDSPASGEADGLLGGSPRRWLIQPER